MMPLDSNSRCTAAQRGDDHQPLIATMDSALVRVSLAKSRMAKHVLVIEASCGRR